MICPLTYPSLRPTPHPIQTTATSQTDAKISMSTTEQPKPWRHFCKAQQFRTPRRCLKTSAPCNRATLEFTKTRNPAWLCSQRLLVRLLPPSSKPSLLTCQWWFAAVAMIHTAAGPLLEPSSSICATSTTSRLMYSPRLPVSPAGRQSSRFSRC